MNAYSGHMLAKVQTRLQFLCPFACFRRNLVGGEKPKMLSSVWHLINDVSHCTFGVTKYLLHCSPLEFLR